MPTEIVLIGCGGHSKVVYEALQLQTDQPAVRIVDADASKNGLDYYRLKVEAPLPAWDTLHGRIHVAIGDNAARRSTLKLAEKAGKELFSVIHPAAVISSNAGIGTGVFIAAGAVVAPDASVGTGCIVNHGAIIDHECSLIGYSHIAPNATLGGNVIIGQGALIGAGAVVLPGVRIGDEAVIGAGSVVTKDVGNGEVIAGVPARILKT